MTITWIGIEERFRGKGLAKYLITLALLYTSIYAPDVTSVILDDDTDNYANGIKDKKERKDFLNEYFYRKIREEKELDEINNIENQLNEKSEPTNKATLSFDGILKALCISICS